MVRLTLGGPGMDGFEVAGPCGHVRLFLPSPGDSLPLVPASGPDGWRWPADRERPPSRAYTPRRWNPVSHELDVDIVLHGHGPGSSWAARAAVGDSVVVAGPRGAYRPDPAADWHLLVGDESALPAIGSILDALPASTRAYVYIEVEDAADEQPLDSAAELHVEWVHRGPDASLAGNALETVIRHVQPDSRGRVFVACEALAMRRIRHFFLEKRRIAREALHTRGYWKYGDANHPDHDTGEDG
jgi:NADPH-dependent ferric siderophore reductase